MRGSAALRAYWYFLQAVMYRVLPELAKTIGIEYVVRHLMPVSRAGVVKLLYESHRGVAYGDDPPSDLAGYVEAASKAHESIAEVLKSVGLGISKIRLISRNPVRVEVENAVPGAGLVVDGELRSYAMAISVGVFLGIVEGLLGKSVGLRIPQIGVELASPDDEYVLEVIEFDVKGNRYVAELRHRPAS